MSDAAVHGLAGAGGGIIAQLITYPLQTVNTLQQTEREVKGSAQKSEHGQHVASSTKRVPSSTLQRALKVIRREGWGGLYRGLPPSLVGTACSQGVYYYFYQSLRNIAEKRQLRSGSGVGVGSIGTLDALVIAAIAGILNVLLTNPIWVIVTRMQTQSQVKKGASTTSLEGRVLSSGGELDVELGSPAGDKLKKHLAPQGTFETVADLYREAGLFGFWKGVIPTLVMVSNPSIQFMVYETLRAQLTKTRLANRAGVKYVSATETFGIGAIAKLVATVITYPLLVIKARLQAKQEIGSNADQQYTGTIDAIVKMLRSEGPGAFYKGLHLKIFQSVFASAILFMTKEELVKFVRLGLHQRQKMLKSLSSTAVA
eukprot:TRINITY_DN20111_c0_g1_i1.p1 TRINITY_DN20111_c0_g1~~TRINITY_DN20111_c0_g1_i1.p1  ORF type:complete len:371 (+),score=75.94 TRINITY_DN20111_c0_g1_i1:110-1222(+)